MLFELSLYLLLGLFEFFLIGNSHLFKEIVEVLYLQFIGLIKSDNIFLDRLFDALKDGFVVFDHFIFYGIKFLHHLILVKLKLLLHFRQPNKLFNSLIFYVCLLKSLLLFLYFFNLFIE